MNTEENRILDYINSITQLDIQDDFILEKCIRTCKLPYSDDDLIKIGQMLIELGYAKMGTSFGGNITSLFRAVNSAGGHHAYAAQKLQSEKDDIKYQAELENLRTTNRLNKWLLKTKWLPHVLSVAAFLISVVALIYAIMTYYGD